MRGGGGGWGVRGYPCGQVKTSHNSYGKCQPKLLSILLN